MNHLRVLVIEPVAEKLDRISLVLREARYEILAVPSFQEAGEALLVQRFDAVLVGSIRDSQTQAEFTTTLRQVEKSRGLLARTPVLVCSGSVPDELWTPTAEEWADGYLGEQFAAATFTDAVLQLAQALSTPCRPGSQDVNPGVAIFEREKFQAQVAYDRELLVEIIDLFMAERISQMAEMQAALTAGEFTRLYRVAHTIKGSLGSLHAPLARLHAQELESAAKRPDPQICRLCLAVLERDLNTLESELIALRNSVVG